MNYSFLYKLCVVVGLVGSIKLNAMEQKQPVIALEPDLISQNAEVGTLVGKAVAQAPKILIKHPSMIFYVKTIVEKGKRIAGEQRGIGNIIHALGEELAKEKYGTLTPQELETIMRLAIAPTPKKDVIAWIEQAKKNGFHIMGTARNQDVVEHGIYREVMQNQHNTNIKELLNGGMITNPGYSVVEHFKSGKDYHELEPGWVVARETYMNPAYLNTMRTLANKTNPDAPIHIFDLKQAQKLDTISSNIYHHHVQANDILSALRDITSEYSADKKQDYNTID